MLEKEIVISKGNILKQYTNLNNNIKSIIEKLYELKEFDKEYQLSANLNITAIKVEDFVKNNKIQNEKLAEYENKTGVYIFLKDNIPVYIGFSGTGNKQGLKERIKKQFSARDNGYSNLVCKIISVEEKLDNEGLKNNIPDIEDISRILKLRKKYYKKSKNEKFIDKAPEIDFNKLQNIILKYTSSLIVINCGEKELENINFAETLEVVLIALFNSKYNG